MNYNSISAVSFRVGNDMYIYDRYSNEFLKIDKITEQILDDTYTANFNPANYEFDAKTVLKRYSEIEKVKADNDVLKPFVLPQLSISKEKSTLEKLQSKVEGQISNLVFCTTENCNLRCKYCIYSGSYANATRVHNAKQLKWNIAKMAIDQYVEMSKKTENANRFISFYGGEPILNFQVIKQVVDYVKKRGIDVQFAMNTNLTLVDEKILKFLIDNNFILSVSIDGPECMHDIYRVAKNEKKSHKTVLENLKIIKNIDNDYFKSKVVFNVVIVPHNYDLDILDNYFDSDIFQNIDIKQFKPLQINYEENSFFSRYDYDEFMRNFEKHSLDKFISVHKNRKTDFSDMKISYQYHIRGFKQIYYREMNRLNEYSFFWPNGICIPGLRSLFVATDGKYYPCEKMSDHNPLIIGNVFDGYDIEDTADLIEEYAKKSLPQCKSCWAFRFCGVCFMSSQVDGNFSAAKKVHNCNMIKQYYYSLFHSYINIVKETPDAFDYLDDTERDIMVNDMRTD
ncbi:Cys-rich peptide radical SAM maturase CcpM [Bacteroidia bacterium]|nr:Cys-rich peptide radical SAM maturase CcpM [Bacteroidia bacterium]